jgi:hypothetical protein
MMEAPMKLQSIKLPLLVLSMIIVIVSMVSAFHPVWAQLGSTKPEPTMTLTLCIVEQTEACPPHGYQKGDMQHESSNCPKLKPQAVIDWVNDNQAHQLVDIPPKEITLTGRIEEVLTTYKNSDPDSLPVNQRAAMVLMFEFKNSQDSVVSIHRVASNRYTSKIESRNWSGSLDNERRLIYHERADAFFPGYHVKWIIRIGGKEWTLRTQG